MEYNKTICVIPCRMGSTRVINKNIRLVNGYPLLAYSIWIARASQFIDKTFVYTDSSEIAKIAFEYNVTPIMRPAYTATNTATDLDWVLAFLKDYEKSYGEYPKTIVHLRTTTPTRRVSVVDSIISAFKEESTSLRSTEPISEAPEKTFRIKDGYLTPLFENMSLEDTNLPNQLFKQSYKANGYCDLLKPEYILANNKLHGDKIQTFITEQVIEIDTEFELQIVDQLFKKELGNG